MNESYTGLRPDLLKHVTKNNCEVLDLGCAAGANGKWLLDSGIATLVEGVEYDPEMASQAAKLYDRVHQLDLNSGCELSSIITDKKFDYILLGDILEHLRDPWTTLTSASTLLRPEGRIIISIPNIGHIDTFIHVFIKGYWPYNDRGIYDRTHLRFFTLQNIKDLVKNAGLETLIIERNFRYRDAMDSRFPFYGSILKSIFKNLYTFQYILVCRKFRSPASNIMRNNAINSEKIDY